MVKCSAKINLELDWDYNAKFDRYVENKFGVLIADSLPSVEIKNLYEYLILEDFDFSNLSNSERSIFYFEGNEELIKIILEECSNVNDLNKNLEIDETKGELIFDANVSPLYKNSSAATKGRKGWFQGNKDTKKNRRAGKIAEMKAYSKLRAKFGKDKVRWVSGFSNTSDKSDELHYDIKYKNEKGDWRFVEVKSFNGSHFHLSNDERKYAEEKENRGFYDFALVQGDDVYMFPGFFGEGVNFENNEMYSATPSDYIISLKVK